MQTILIGSKDQRLILAFTLQLANFLVMAQKLGVPDGSPDGPALFKSPCFRESVSLLCGWGNAVNSCDLSEKTLASISPEVNQSIPGQLIHKRRQATTRQLAPSLKIDTEKNTLSVERALGSV
ncbi:hypothetical protein TWF225_006035 [Orbilia oligospora]|nr:hypothetical protein TWF225_006035 [Orbilia oligospora]KAF3242959.1 hypothetical protein TWF128_010407 [Orbilia oligospora]KAF3257798.1 hypothetical protein TWF217_005904 [Orbilia oligospora]